MPWHSWHIAASKKLCLFEALYPAPSARPFFKGLLRWLATLWLPMKAKMRQTLFASASSFFIP